MSRPPDIVLLMADQLAAPALACYGGTLAPAPAIDRLAAEGMVFDRAYCNSPICAPSRYSMLAGRLPHAIGAYDNATEFASSIPTMAHYLAAAGYRTILAGKMHFVGPDQLHGYAERLTTDIYPAEFLWVPDWSKGPAHKPTGVGMTHVVDAGPCLRNMQIDYDEEVAHVAVQRVWDIARERARAERGGDEASPFFLTVSFTHPHPPFVAPEDHWDRIDPARVPMPSVPEIAFEQLDPHSQWLYLAHGQDRHRLTAEHVRRARRAYAAMVSYVDEKIGAVLDALERSGLASDALVVFCADHGEMMGERGMWFKQTFYEWSSRVPLVFRWPGRANRGRSDAVCSLVDLLPTFIEAASAMEVVPVDPLAGRSLLGLVRGAADPSTREALAEYSSEGVAAASRMLRTGRWKYIVTHGLPPMLYDLDADPAELRDLAGDPAHAAIEAALRERIFRDWDADAIDRDIRASQRRRLFLRDLAQRQGTFPQWTHEVRPGDAGRFVRPSTAGGPVGPKPRSRFPYRQPTPPDAPKG